MSYSDEIPRPQKRNVRTNPGNVQRKADPLFQPPTPVDPDPAPMPDVRPPAHSPIPAPRQAVHPQQAAPTQQPPRQVAPQQPPRQAAPQQGVVGNQSISVTPTQPRQQPAPQPQQPVQQPRQPQPQVQPDPRQGRVSVSTQSAPQQIIQPQPTRNQVPQSQPQVQTRQAPAEPVSRTEPPAEKPKPAPASTPPATSISVGKERPSAPLDRSKLTFESGSKGEKVDPKDLLLNTEGLVKIYDGRTVVNGVNINVKKGEIVGLLGPNGAGKTTSFYMMVGLVPPNGGRVTFDGQDVTKLPMYKRARLGMGYLPQEESIFRKLTVEENIMAVMQTMKYSRKEKKAKCDELLERFSITHIRKNIAMTCSGGEKRRVTIARSLVPDPSLIMLDEPFGGVDPIAVGEIQGIVKDLRKEGLAVLITDHNARETLDLVDRAYLICEGRVLREGPKEFLVNDPVSRELYLGERFSM